MEPVIEWLTENSDPYIKYLTLKNILGKRVNKKRSPKIIDNIANSKTASAILNLQNKESWWSVNTYSFNHGIFT